MSFESNPENNEVTLFEENMSNQYGGAIYNGKDSLLSFKGNTEFSKNVARQGGAIYNTFAKSNKTVVIFDGEDSTALFDSNKAMSGGAIYNSGEITFKGKTQFQNNLAQTGGAIYNQGTINVEGTVAFSENFDKVVKMNLTQSSEVVELTVNGVEKAVTLQKLSYSGDESNVEANDIYNTGTINVKSGGIVMLDGGITGKGKLNILEGGSLFFAEDATAVVAQTSDKALLSIAKPFEVNGTINVGDVTGLTGNLNFGSNSIFELDASLENAFTNDVQMAILEGSKLVINNPQANEGMVIAVVDGSGYVWGDKTADDETGESSIVIVGGTVLHDVKVERRDVLTRAASDSNGQVQVVLVVDVKDAASVFPTLTSSNSLDELVTTLNEENGDAPIGARMLRTLLFTEDTNTPIVDVVNEVSSSAVVIGVQNTALRLADTASNTVLDRMSLAQRSASEGVNLWAVPVYGNLYSSDMVMSGASVRGQFGGVAVGADVEVGDFLGGKYRFGASFNVGGGQSRSKGTTISAKNNFDFGGVNVYGAWTKGAFNVIGSLGYGYGNHELALGLPMVGFASADSDVDTKALTADLRAEYLVKTDVMDILPHVGVRYTALKTDAHDLMVGGDVLNSVKADTQYIVQFPIGVTLSKDLAWSDWAVKPMIDLSVIPATGDKHLTTMVNFSGLKAWDNVSARVLDRTSWTGTFGVQAQKGNFTLGMNYGVQHASNETDQSIQVKLNWMF